MRVKGEGRRRGRMARGLRERRTGLYEARKEEWIWKEKGDLDVKVPHGVHFETELAVTLEAILLLARHSYSSHSEVRLVGGRFSLKWKPEKRVRSRMSEKGTCAISV